jgi:hypothetical protein
MFLRHGLVAVLAALSLSLAPWPNALQRPVPEVVDEVLAQISVAELRRSIEHLASDDLAGRGLGQPGNVEAERYLASALRDANVRPVGDSFLHRLELYSPVAGPDPWLRVEKPGGELLLDVTAGPDFHPLPSSAGTDVRGRLIQGGHGISVPGIHDDYQRLDVRGAIVMALEGAPAIVARLPGRSDAEKDAMASLEHKVSAARRHGAAGLIIVQHYPGDPRVSWPEHTSARAREYRLYDDVRNGGLAVVVVSDSAARPIRHALARRGELTASIRPAVIAEPFSAHNVLGLVEGRGERDGIVVIGAHFDHDGTDEAGQIFNGADDNASGTAAVLAVAAAFTRAAARGTRPARTVVFGFWNAEEKGFLGAESFARAPLPSGPVVAKINLDMVGRAEHIPDPADPRFAGFARTTAAASADVVHLLGYSYSPDMARIVDRANQSGRLKVRAAYDRGAQNLVRRSRGEPPG